MPATATTTVSSTMNDAELLRIGTGTGPDSERAWSELVQRHRPRLLNFVRGRYSVSDGRAEELVQHSLMKLYSHAHRVDPAKGSVRSYLNAIAANRGKNQMRDDSRDPTLPISVLDVGTENDRPWVECRTNGGRDPSDELRRRELEAAVEESLNDMKTKMADVLRHRRAGRTYAEIAAEMDVRPGTVKSRMRRGRRRLAKRLKRRGYDVEDVLA